MLAGFGVECRCRDGNAAAAMETMWKQRRPASSFFSLTRVVSELGFSLFPKTILMFVRFPLNRKSSTHRRETGPDGPSHAGEYPRGSGV